MADGPLGGVLYILVMVAVAAAVIGAVLYEKPLLGGAVRVGRRLHLVREPPPSPAGMPLERIAQDLRRLRPQTVHDAGEPMARHLGALAAYDGALADACRALDIRTDLPGLPEGMARETERLRVEVELQQAGVDLHDP